MAIKCPKCQAENPDTQKFCGECATPLVPSKEIPVSHTKTLEIPAEDLSKGTLFADRYKIIEELGRGGMGKVYRVEDTKIHEEVALKLIKPEIAVNKLTIERFSNELKFARKITHKNVCRMHDINEEKGNHYITMEYVRGEDLKSVVKPKGKLSLGNVLAISMQITDGLAEAHRLGIVHRDLKPQNIMIDVEGNAKIMDFGIARSLEGQGMTVEGMIVGSPEYMSPEQVDGQRADQRADIYSLGVILYEMVTGKTPFEGETAFSIAMKHKTEVPSDPMALNSKLPKALSHLILRCMEKDREKRYQSAEELLAELMTIERSLPEKERVAQRIMLRLEKPKEKKFSIKRAFVLAGLAIVVVVAGIFTWRLLTPPQPAIAEPGKPRVAIVPFKNNSGDLGLDHLRDSLSNLLTNDLIQSKYILVLPDFRIYSVLNKLNLLEAENFSDENLHLIAEEASVSHIIQGAYTKLGDTYLLTVTLLDANTLEAIAAENEEGQGDESLGIMVDNLTKKLKPLFNLSDEEIASDYDENIASVTSTNLHALQFYTEALKVRNKGVPVLEHFGDVPQAADLLEKAVALDPDFAMAYIFLSGAHNTMALNEPMGSERDKHWQKYGEYIIKAHEAIQRRPVSERERLFIEGRYLYMTGKRVEAFETNKKLVELYPDDYNGNLRLAYHYKTKLEDYDKAKEHYEVIIRNNTANAMVYNALIKMYLYQGMNDKARELIGEAKDRFPESPNFNLLMAESYIQENKFELALSELDRGIEIDPLWPKIWSLRGYVFYFMEDFEAAEQEFRKLMNWEGPGVRAKGRWDLINLCLIQGRFEDVLSQIRLAIEEQEVFDPGIFFLNIIRTCLMMGEDEEALRMCEIEGWGDFFKTISKGLIYAQMKAWDKVDDAVIQVEQILQDKELDYREAWGRHYVYLLGKIESEKGNFKRAIEHFEQAKSTIPALHYVDYWLGVAFFVGPLAMAYYHAGDLDAARLEFESILSMTEGRLYYGDIYAKTLYMLGKIHEQQGNTARAIEHYEKFLDLWKDADPGIAEIEDTRVRLAGLKGK